jgi:hypothetical protein
LDATTRDAGYDLEAKTDFRCNGEPKGDRRTLYESIEDEPSFDLWDRTCTTEDATYIGD